MILKLHFDLSTWTFSATSGLFRSFLSERKVQRTIDLSFDASIVR